MPFIGDPRAGFTVSKSHAAKVSVVAVRGELTIATVPELQPALEEAVAAGGPVVVDLAEVSFMDSQGLFALLVLRKRLVEQSCGLAVACDPDGAVAMVFRVSGTYDLFHIHPSCREAAAAVRR